MQFEGAWTALVTPFRPDRRVDWEGFRKNLEFQVSQGIKGVVPVGTTGESPGVTWQEHNQLVVEAIKCVEGRCGLIAGAGSNSTEEALASTRHAARHGAKAVLLVDCYYNGPSSQELRDEYYSRIAGTKPHILVVPYIIPGRTSTALAPEDLAILAARHPNIRAVKEATGDLDRMARTRELVGPDFSILSGDDDLTYQMMADSRIKACGVISVTSNVAPRAVAIMVQKMLEDDVAGAAKLRDALAPLFSIVTVKVKNERRLPDGRVVPVEDKYRNPVPIKTLMSGLGMPAGPPRPPLGRMSRAGVEVVRNAARKVWQKNPEILQPIEEFFGVDIEARLADDSCWPFMA